MSKPNTALHPQSTLTIDAAMAQSSYSPSFKHNRTQPRPRSVHTALPQDELTSKIANNFEQFSSMLTQMQKNTKKEKRLARTPSTRAQSLPAHSLPATRHRPSPPSPPPTVAPASPLYPTSPEPTTAHIHAHPVTPLPQAPTKRIVFQNHQLVTDFLGSASNGHLAQLQAQCATCTDLLFAADHDSGSTALMVAICFNQPHVATWLINQDCPVNEQDNEGWTALMWATSLQRASLISSVTGNLAYDLIWSNDPVMTPLLKTHASSSRRTALAYERKLKQKQSIQKVKAARRQSTPTLTTSTFHHSGIDAYTHFMNTEAHQHQSHLGAHLDTRSTRRQSSLGLLHHQAILPVAPPTSSLFVNHPDGQSDDEDSPCDSPTTLASLEASLRSAHTFDWDHCLVDQMFAFSMDDLPTLLDLVMLPPPARHAAMTRHDDTLWIPADLLFLCARFAYFYLPRQDLHHFFQTALARLVKVTKSCKGRYALCYWLANIHLLLSYLKRDTHFAQTTLEQQDLLANIATDVYFMLLNDCTRQMGKLVGAGFMDVAMDKDMAAIRFEDQDQAREWTKFFQRRGSSTSAAPPPASPSPLTATLLDGGSKSPGLGPTLILQLLDDLTSLADLLLPPWLAQHLVQQTLYHLLAESFNHILQHRRFLCRSLAFQIRLNLSVIEGWIKKHHLPICGVLGTTFERLVQLLQLLQCITSLHHVNDFVATCRGLTLLHPLQLRRCVVGYRYETNEPHLSPDMESWIQQQAAPFEETATPSPPSNKVTPASVDHFRQQLLPFLLAPSSAAATQPAPPVDQQQQEWLDTHLLLPVSSAAPSQRSTNIDLLWSSSTTSESMYHQLKEQAKREKKTSALRVPSLSYKFIEKLDKKLGNR
ncbi:hypothetical protein DM01DRAFT_1335076 [Hesseltinella vesiculosa]|uniref:Dilute domain-containing protein n=1 Tax=Hesseltinella vesiculosa TaxID=101127 RepID=A0A1X2GJZ4_9FUNG|nr:hypothetical protein DM01DRAFT_1335076 [Hesseltinella vesiculosa]